VEVSGPAEAEVVVPWRRLGERPRRTTEAAVVPRERERESRSDD
jgi:hypothetical protein